MQYSILCSDALQYLTLPDSSGRSAAVLELDSLTVAAVLVVALVERYSKFQVPYLYLLPVVVEDDC